MLAGNNHHAFKYYIVFINETAMFRVVLMVGFRHLS